MSRNSFDAISANEMFKRRLLLGEKLAGFGNRPKKIPDAEAFIRYRFARKNGKVVRQPIAI